MKTDTKKEKKDTTIKVWIAQVFILTFVLSVSFSFLSTVGINKLSIFPAVLLLLFVIFMGVIFDIIGVAVTVANEHEFHAKASKKVKGSKKSLVLIKNSAKVANICADVIGDICGVLSGAISALISFKITENMGVSGNIQYLMSGIVAALTVSGKAIGKEMASAYATPIVHKVGVILHKFEKEEKTDARKNTKNDKQKVVN